VQTLDLCYFAQTLLVAPIESFTLSDVHDALCGREEGSWWEESFYKMDGVYKLLLCNRILKNPNDSEAREQLKNANRADILALGKVVKKVMELNQKVEEGVKLTSGADNLK